MKLKSLYVFGILSLIMISSGAWAHYGAIQFKIEAGHASDVAWADTKCYSDGHNSSWRRVHIGGSRKCSGLYMRVDYKSLFGSTLRKRRYYRSSGPTSNENYNGYCSRDRWLKITLRRGGNYTPNVYCD